MVSRVSATSFALSALAGLMLASTAACAADGPHAGFGWEVADGVLTELPSHPPAGTCYAKVKVLKDVDAPPPGAHAVWRQTPALPGALGPTWCLVMEPGHDTPSVDQLERVGWVRVLCDTDITPDRVRGLQKKLHAHGEYEGEETGRYDQTTADAVARFQHERKIEHGGYLSLQTVDAIEHVEAPRAARQYAQAERSDDAYALGRPGVLPPIHVTGCCAPPPPPVQVRVPVPYPVEVRVPVPQPYPVEVRVPVPQPYPVEVRVPVPQPYPVYVPQPRPYPVYVPQPQPCCAAPPPPPIQPCCAPPPAQPCCQGGGQGYGPQGPNGGPDYTQPYGQHAGYLNWAGKTLY